MPSWGEVAYGVVSEDLCRYLLDDIRATAGVYRNVWAECRRQSGHRHHP